MKVKVIKASMKLRTGFNNWQATEPLHPVLPIEALSRTDDEAGWVWVFAFNVHIKVFEADGEIVAEVFKNGRRITTYYVERGDAGERLLGYMRRIISESL